LPSKGTEIPRYANTAREEKEHVQPRTCQNLEYPKIRLEAFWIDKGKPERLSAQARDDVVDYFVAVTHAKGDSISLIRRDPLSERFYISLIKIAKEEPVEGGNDLERAQR